MQRFLRFISYNINLNGLNATESIGKSISKFINKGDNILLYGDIGVGKTSFCRGLIREFYNNNDLIITSPSFILDNEYNYNNKIIHHMDLYRLRKYKDCKCLGIDDLFISDDILLIEWPERLQLHFPNNYLNIIITNNIETDNRIFNIKTYGNLWDDRIIKWINSIKDKDFIDNIKQIN